MQILLVSNQTKKCCRDLAYFAMLLVLAFHSFIVTQEQLRDEFLICDKVLCDFEKSVTVSGRNSS